MKLKAYTKTSKTTFSKKKFMRNIILVFVLGLSMLSFECTQRMTKAEIIAKQGLYATMPPDFDFDFKFKVISYDWIYKGRGDAFTGSSQGSKFPEALVSHIQAGKKDDIILFENVKVKGDDNSIRKIAGLSIMLR